MIKSQKDEHIKQLKAQIKDLSSRQKSSNGPDQETAVLIGTKNMEISGLKKQISELKERMEQEKKNLMIEDKIEYYVLWLD